MKPYQLRSRGKNTADNAGGHSSPSKKRPSSNVDSTGGLTQKPRLSASQKLGKRGS